MIFFKFITRVLFVTFFIISFLLFSCNGQEKSSGWKTLEKISSKEKTKYILSLKNEFPYFNDLVSNTKPYLDKFTFIDLDNDGDNDLIYIGESGAEPKCVRIFLNNKNTFNKVFDEFSNKPKFTFEDGKLINLKVFQTHCCGEGWDLHIKYFLFKTSNNKLKNNKIEDYYVFEANEEPLNYVKHYMVKTTKTINARFSPAIGIIPKKEYKEELKMSENIIGNLKTDVLLNVIGEKKDNSDGRTWLYVEAKNNQFEKDKFVIFGDEDEFTIRGWISKKNVETIVANENNILSTVISSKWIGNYQKEFIEKFTDGTSNISTWSFLINKNNVVQKNDTYPTETKYKVVEKNNQLELFCTDSNCQKTDADFIIKKENDKLYIKGKAFENGNKWLFFEKVK